MTKSIYLTLCSAFAIACIFSGCQSSKIAYGNTHYFKQTPKAMPVAEAHSRMDIPEKVVSERISSEDLQASVVQQVQQTDAEAMMKTAQKQLNSHLEKSGNAHLKQRVAHINSLAAAAKDQHLTKKEAKAKRKEIRKEIKSLAKAYRETAAPNKAEGLGDLDKNLRLAIVFWGVGLILSIIAVASSVPPIAIISSLAWLVGTVFFIIWLVEELD